MIMTLTFELWAIMLKKGHKLAFILLILGTPITLVMDIFYSIYLIETNIKDDRWKREQRSYLNHSLLKTFSPFGDISKNLADTFKPFKYNIATELQRILQQPYYGFANVVSGIYRLITAPMVGIAATAYHLLLLIVIPYDYNYIFRDLASTLENSLYRALNGSARIIAGLAQLALTPFNWTLKPFIRGMITIESPITLIENNAGIKERLATVNLSSTDRDHRTSTFKDINRKFHKCRALGQETAIKPHKEDEYYSTIMRIAPASLCYDVYTTTQPNPSTAEINYYHLINNPTKFFEDRKQQKFKASEEKQESTPRPNNGF
jgi:hypothetical protein